MMKINSNKDNFLLYIPRKRHMDWELRKGRVYLIFNHDKSAEKFLRWLVKKPYISDIELDEIGSFVWESIDGGKTIYDISMNMVEKYGESCQPIYERIIMYLRYLNKKGWIAFDKGPQDSMVN